MKRIIVIICFIISCIAISGCKIGNSEKTNGNSIELSGAESLDVTQPYFDTGIHSVAKGENGYYYIRSYIDENVKGMNKYITYYDEKQQKAIKLCGNAECKHIDNNCMAYLGLGDYFNSIYYYKNNLYIIKLKEGNAVLERVKADGSSRQELGALCTSSGEGDVRLVFCGDFAYATNAGEQLEGGIKKKIYKFSLKDYKSEVIYEGENIQNLRVYGDKVYFVESYNEKVNEQENISVRKGKGLLAVNESGVVTTVVDASISDYSIDMQNKKIYYYVYNEGLYEANLNDNSTRKLYEATLQTGWCDLSFDGNYLYMNNKSWSQWGTYFGGVEEKIEPKCLVYDKKGNLFGEADVSKVNTMYYGDSKYMFAEISEYSPDFCLVDKSKFQMNFTSFEWQPISKD